LKDDAKNRQGFDNQAIIGANLLEVFSPTARANPWDEKDDIERGKRGQIVGFSPEARYRLAKELSAIDWPVTPAHITLTYGQNWPKDPKAHLAAIRKFCMRDSGWCGVWRLEFQKRGAPHFHLLLFGCTEASEDRFRRWWSRRSRNDSQHAFKATYRDAGRASWYLALHSTKDTQAPRIKVGRWWGWIDRDRVRSFRRRENIGTLSLIQRYRLARIARRLTKGKIRPSTNQNFSLFLNYHNQMRLLHYLETVDPIGDVEHKFHSS